jgi:hypothetical protein
VFRSQIRALLCLVQTSSVFFARISSSPCLVAAARVLVRFVFSCRSRSPLRPCSLHLSLASVFLVLPVKLRSALGFRFHSRRRHSGLRDFPLEESVLPAGARRQGRILFPLTCGAPRPALPQAGFVFHG